MFLARTRKGRRRRIRERETGGGGAASGLCRPLHLSAGLRRLEEKIEEERRVKESAREREERRSEKFLGFWSFVLK